MVTVFDAHCDAPSQMYRLRDYGIDNKRAQVDFPKMQRGKVTAAFFAAYVPSSLKGEKAYEYASTLLDTLDRQMEANSELAAYACRASEVLKNQQEGKISIMRAIENASALNESMDRLKEFHERGVRYITLTHSADNEVADSCTGQEHWGGLSPFGRDLVGEMNRLGMLIDLAHSSFKAMKDVLEISQRPVAYTHGCCYSLASHKRNITDELMRAIAEKGGIVCISIYPSFLDDKFDTNLERDGMKALLALEDEFIKEPSNQTKALAWSRAQESLEKYSRPGIEAVCEHILHAIKVAGVEHVGIGTDYDGIEMTAEGLENISKMPALWKSLKERGVSESDIEKIAGQNLLRVLKSME